MADDLSDVWNPFEKTSDPTFLIESNDGVLSTEQLFCSMQNVFWRHLDDLEYLHNNPEIRAIIRLIFKELLTAKPYDILKHLAMYFNASKCKLRILIQENIEERTAACQRQTDTTSQTQEGKLEKMKEYANFKDLQWQIQVGNYQRPSVIPDSYEKLDSPPVDNDRTSVSLFTDYWDIGKSEIVKNITYES